MKREDSLVSFTYARIILGVAILMLTSICYADKTMSLSEQSLQAEKNATATYNNALATRQAITQFVNKTAISDQASQLVVYVSLNTTSDQRPSEVSVEIKVDGASLGQTNYSPASISALLNGASHKALVNNIAPGSHDMIVHIKEKHGDQYINSNGAIRFDKASQRKVFELLISLSENDIPPEVVFLDHL